MLLEDATFFAHSPREYLTWAEDPGDHPLMTDVSVALIARYHRIMATAPKANKAKLRVNVLRNGKRRISVPVAA